jgi:uncharacterized membrane protein
MGKAQSPGQWNKRGDGIKVLAIVVPLVLAGAIAGTVLGLTSKPTDSASATTTPAVTTAVTTTPTAITQVSSSGGQEAQAQDAMAKSLVRNAMTAIESAYVDLRTFDPTVMTKYELETIAPSVAFFAMDDDGVATNPGAAAAQDAVDYFGTDSTYAVGTVSESGTTFGVIVDKGPTGVITFYKDGEAADW